MTSHFRTFECIHSTIPGVFGAMDLHHASGVKEATPIGTRGSQVSQSNFFEKLACLPATKSGQQPPRFHAMHRKFTTKTPPPNTTFSKTTHNKARKAGRFQAGSAQRNLFENQARFFEKFRIPSTWKSFSPAFSTYTSRLFPLGSVGLRKKPVSRTKSLVLLMIPSIISPS